MSVATKIGRFVLYSILIIIVLLIGMLQTADINQYKFLLETQLGKMTGLEVKLNGPMKINVIPLPHIVLNDAMVKADLKNNKEIRAQFKEMSFSLPWQTLYRDIKELKNIDTTQITIQYFEHDKAVQSISVEKFKGNIISTFYSVEISNLEILFGKDLIKGKLIYGAEKDKKVITGNLTSAQWVSLLSSKNIKKDKIISSKTLHDEWMKQLEAQIHVKIDKLYLQDKQLDNALFEVQLKEGLLTVIYKGDNSVSQNRVLQQMTKFANKLL